MSVSGKVLWGEAQPRIRLKKPSGQLVRQFDRLPGKATWTSGSASVATTEDLSSYVSAGEIVSWSKDPNTGNYVVASVSSSAITLASPALEDKSGVNIYSNIAVLTLPYATETVFQWWLERRDGGAVRKRLNDGKIRNRSEGIRCRIDIRWDFLERSEFTKLVYVFNHQLSRSDTGGVGLIELQPHINVKTKFSVNMDDSFNPGWPAGKLVGTSISVGFETVDLLPNVPVVSSGLKGGPAIW